MNGEPAHDEQQLLRAIAAQEQLRGVVPDDVVDAAVAALRERIGTGASSERRRQVTVLFADVGGFTALSSRLDAEVVAGMMNSLWSTLDAIVHEHGGRVDKHIGDALMAVWGADSTGEDDPERAVHAALALQQELSGTSSEHPLTMRVGINTGPVHLGSVGAGAEFTAIGDAVNVASRVEALSPSGGVLVTHDTYRHIRGVFDVEALAPRVVKGKSDPIRLYLVVRRKERAFRMPTRGVEGVETGMIGRAHELAMLQEEFDQAVGQASARRVTVIGDAGVGKSRLLYEFENWIELHPVSAYFFKGRALAINRSVPFGLMRDLVGERFGILDSDATGVVASKMRVGFGPMLRADEADLVGHWLGFDLRSTEAVQRLLGSGQLASAARAHLFRALEAMSDDGPVVMFFEDLHWADDESLLLIDELAVHLTSRRLLIVGVGRPSLLERDGASRLLDRSSTHLQLDPLDGDATRQLVDEILQKVETVPISLIELIVERADGNAFFVEELVKMMMEDGVIETGAPWEAWRVREELLDLDRIPATLTGVLQTRLDSLDPVGRDVLQRASIVGRVFWDGTVAALADEPVDRTSRSLDIARRRELVLRRPGSSFDSAAEFVFKHALLRDVTYETVLLRDRDVLHRRVAQWITEHAGERIAEYVALIATHHRMAGDEETAAVLLERAAIDALEAGNAAAARRSLDEAFELRAAIGLAPAIDSLTAMTEACIRLGDFDAADACNTQALGLEASAEQRVRALYLGSWIASERGDRDREWAQLNEAMPAAEQLGGVPLAELLCGLAQFEIDRGDSTAAAGHAERAGALLADLRHPALMRQVFSVLAAIAGQRDDAQQQLHFADQALAVVSASGDLDGQAVAHHNLAVTHHLLGDRGERDEYQVALDHYLAASAMSARLGRTVKTATILADMGQLYVRLGDEPMARRCILEALTTLRDAGAGTSLVFTVLADADRRLTFGDEERALALVGLVRSRPEATKAIIDDIEMVLGRSGLGSATIEAGTRRGSTLDFDTTVDELIDELTPT